MDSATLPPSTAPAAAAARIGASAHASRARTAPAPLGAGTDTHRERQPRCNWTPRELANNAYTSMPLLERIAALRAAGIVYNEPCASHWLSAPERRAELDARPPTLAPASAQQTVPMAIDSTHPCHTPAGQATHADADSVASESRDRGGTNQPSADATHDRDGASRPPAVHDRGASSHPLASATHSRDESSCPLASAPHNRGGSSCPLASATPREGAASPAAHDASTQLADSNRTARARDGSSRPLAEATRNSDGSSQLLAEAHDRNGSSNPLARAPQGRPCRARLPSPPRWDRAPPNPAGFGRTPLARGSATQKGTGLAGQRQRQPARTHTRNTARTLAPHARNNAPRAAARALARARRH